jgi:ABC-2 type transport system ATP-binding protein
MQPIIKVEGISKSFYLRSWRTLLLHRSPKCVSALSDVSLSVGRGEVLGLLGPNGAGKTTLIKILATLIMQDDGSASVSGCDVAQSPELVRAKIGLVNTNERSFYWRLTGKQNLNFFAKLYNLHGKGQHQRVQELLDFVGLADKANTPFTTFSTGQRQRLAIARSLLSEPEVLLFDEPTSSLDPIGSAELIKFVKHDLVGEYKKTVIWCTHDLNEAEKVSDQIVIINQGKIVVQGDINQIKQNLALTPTCRIEVASCTEDFVSGLAHKANFIKHGANKAVIEVTIAVDEVPQLIEDLVNNDVDVYSCTMIEPTLEEIFVDAVDSGKQ